MYYIYVYMYDHIKLGQRAQCQEEQQMVLNRRPALHVHLHHLLEHHVPDTGIARTSPH